MRRRLSLRQRLFVLTAVALAPALAVLVYNLLAQSAARERDVHAQAFRTGQHAALEMDRIVSGTENVLRALAAAPVLQSFDPQRCSAYLADVTEQLPQLRGLSVIDLSGRLRCDTDMPEAAVQLEDRQYFREAVASGKFLVGEYAVGRVSRKPFLPIAGPVRGRNGEVIAVIVASLDLDWLAARLRERTYSQGNSLTIADRNGVILAREPFPERFIGTRIPDEFQFLVRGNEPGTIELTSQDGMRRVLGYFPAAVSPEGLYVSAGVSLAEAQAQLRQSTLAGLGLILAGTGLAFLTAWLFGRRLVQRPVRRMLETIGAWKAGRHAVRTGMSEEDGELESVGSAIDGFLDELEEDRRARRRAEEHRELVVRELDHRVKNIFATVDAVMTQTLKDSGTAPASLERLSQRLAAMAKAHELLLADNWTGAAIADAVDTAIEPFRGGHESSFETTGPNVRIRPNAALALSMALHELCTNAAKYGALRDGGGRIRIDWTLSHEADRQGFRLAWSEHDGPPVEAPAKKGGFGSRMIERVLAAELNASVELRFAETGVVCTIAAPAADVLAESAQARPPQAELRREEVVEA